MKKVLDWIAAALVAIGVAALGGCGGGGGASPAATVEVAAVADVTFVNVPTTSTGSVLPGQLAAEVAAFREKWKDPSGSRGSVTQLVFANTEAKVDLSATFAAFHLVKSGGVDVATEAPYFVNVDTAAQTVTIDFVSYSWFANDFGMTPETYSLVASIDPRAALGTKFAFKLVAVQMHAYGETVSPEVVGGTFMVTQIAGAGLPTVTPLTYTAQQFDSAVVGQQVVVGAANITCNAGDYACVPKRVKLTTSGFSGLQVYINGSLVNALGGDSGTVEAYFAVTPGQTVTVVVIGQLLRPNTTASMSVVFDELGTEVAPIVPDSGCGMFVEPQNRCKG